MRKETLKTLILWLAVLAAVLVPCLTLFEEGDWLFYVIRDSAMHKEWIETGILAVLLAIVCLCIKNRKVLCAVLVLLLLTVSYLHSMLLPLLLAGTWFAVLMLTGNIVEGIALTIVAAGLLSLFGQCRPLVLAAVTLALQLALRFGFGYRSENKLRVPEDAKENRLLLALIGLVLLVQIGRANECIDFDSLWYGVRSLFVLTPGGSIFEDLGLVGMVYTYPKGFEILTLPLNVTESYAVISAFNLFLFMYGLCVTARIAGRFAGNRGSFLAVLFTVLVPGIVNMTLSAKPDMITWMLQLVMLERFFAAVSGEGSFFRKALPVLSVYLLSLTMKPTALIFSTALFGMMAVWTLYRMLSRKKELTAVRDEKEKPGFVLLSELFLSAAALLIVWGRTLKLTGMPFTSVFTGILEKLGFTMKYPFSSRALPRSWQEGSQLLVALKRMAKILLSPDGKDMSHVIIAWGGSLFFVLGVLILWNLVTGNFKREKEEKNLSAAALTVFLPFMLTCFVTLMMLYQVDGNYYMMLYSIVILLAVLSGSEKSLSVCGARAAAFALLLGFQFVMMTMTNWAGVTGFTEICINAGLYSHRDYYEKQLTETDGSLYELLSADPETRVVAFGEHPTCLQFGCIVQSYNDITSPWGNVEIVNTADAFIDYLHFAKVDYVYGDSEHLSEDAWQWSRGLAEEMAARGVLTDFVYEGLNWVAKVN